MPDGLNSNTNTKSGENPDHDVLLVVAERVRVLYEELKKINQLLDRLVDQANVLTRNTSTIREDLDEHLIESRSLSSEINKRLDALEGAILPLSGTLEDRKKTQEARDQFYNSLKLAVATIIVSSVVSGIGVQIVSQLLQRTLFG